MFAARPPRARRTLEDDPVFDAGLGSALTRDGRVEMDAVVMWARVRPCP